MHSSPLRLSVTLQLHSACRRSFNACLIASSQLTIGQFWISSLPYPILSTSPSLFYLRCTFGVIPDGNTISSPSFGAPAGLTYLLSSSNSSHPQHRFVSTRPSRDSLVPSRCSRPPHDLVTPKYVLRWTSAGLKLYSSKHALLGKQSLVANPMHARLCTHPPRPGHRSRGSRTRPSWIPALERSSALLTRLPGSLASMKPSTFASSTHYTKVR